MNYKGNFYICKKIKVTFTANYAMNKQSNLCDELTHSYSYKNIGYPYLDIHPFIHPITPINFAIT
jgi:hypothetical protein